MSSMGGISVGRGSRRSRLATLAMLSVLATQAVVACGFGLDLDVLQRGCPDCGDAVLPGRDGAAATRDGDVADVMADVADERLGDSADACPAVTPLGGDAAAPAMTDGGSLPGPPAARCSQGTPGPPLETTIEWVNTACVPVETWWVDFNCFEAYYGDVPAMGSGTQPTYADHRWRLRAKGTHVLLREVSASADAAPTKYTFP